MADWFKENAPKGDDWFSQNAPGASAPAFQGNPARNKRQTALRASGTQVTPIQAEQERHAGTVEGGLEQASPIARTSLGGLMQLGTGAQQIGRGEYAKGGSNFIRGGLTAAAPASLPVGIFSAPLATALAAAGGAAGEGLGQGAAYLLGANEDQQRLAGDLGGLAVGSFAASKSDAASQKMGDLMSLGKDTASKILAIAKKDPELASDVGGLLLNATGVISPSTVHGIKAAGYGARVAARGIRVAGKISDIMAQRGEPSPVVHSEPVAEPVAPIAEPSAPIDPGKAEMASILRRLLEMEPGSNPSPRDRAPQRFDQGSGPVIDSYQRRIRGEGQLPAANPGMVKPQILDTLPENSPLLKNAEALRIAQELAEEMSKSTKPKKTNSGKVK